MFILFAILAFGLLILTHELGHFLVAKACGVKVLEFSIGMGPQLWHREKGETVYSLRALPMGGFCAMEGEEESSDDPRAFSNQSAWKRLAILLAGAGMNFVLGFILTACLFAGAAGFNSATIAGFFEGCPYEGDLQTGDTIVSVNGERVYFAGNFSQYVTRGAEDGTIELTVRRDGKKVTLRDYPMVPVEYPAEDGGTELKYGIYFAAVPRTFGNWLRYSWVSCMDFVRMVRLALTDLFTGGAKVSEMSGVVGMVDVISETGQSAPTLAEGLENMTYLVAFIAVNLAVMNLLPIPALDGGHVLTLLLSAAYEKITGKKPDPRIEQYIHSIGLILLLGLMAVVMYNDVVRIIKK